MTLLEFASRYRLRMKRDDCGDQTVLGKRGIISEFDPSKELLAPTSGHHPLSIGTRTAEQWRQPDAPSRRMVTLKARPCLIRPTRNRPMPHSGRFRRGGNERYLGAERKTLKEGNCPTRCQVCF